MRKSYDEARLKNAGDFKLALAKVSEKIAPAMERAHIVVTSRPSAWRPKSDLDNYKKYLPYIATTVPEEGSNSDNLYQPGLNSKIKSCFKIFTLVDLNVEQIKCFLKSLGVLDIKEFLNAVERTDTWDFATRPQDLQEMTAFWLQEKRIGSQLELIEHSINKRLQEIDQDRAEARPIAKNKLFQGAMLLAAATTLSKNPTIRVPDGTDNLKGITAKEILTDWDEAEIQTLLSRPVFDEAIYGTVRFHHRSVREYLTAKWFARLLQKETSRRRLEHLFFHEQYGQIIARPTLRPILPWLCILDEKIRSRTLQLAPEIALEGGDPSHWPLQDRQRVLRDVCKQITNGVSDRLSTNNKAIKRFSKEDIANDIKGLISQYKSHDELCAFLLEMVWLGEISEALPEVMEIAQSKKSQKRVRIMAFRALGAIGSEVDRKTVRNNIIAESQEVDRRLFAELTESEQPNAETIEWLITGIEKCQEKEEYSFDYLSQEIEAFVVRTPDEMLPILTKAFDRFLSQAPFIDSRHNQISEKHEWLLKPAITAVRRLVSSRNEAALMPACLGILHKIFSAKTYQSRELPSDLSDLIEKIPVWSELNRALFWFEVERERETLEREDEELKDWRCVSVFGRFWKFDTTDFDYMVENIESQPLDDNKLIALSLAFSLYVYNGRLRKWRETLKRLTKNNSKLSNAFSAMLNPPIMSSEQRRWKAQERRFEKQRHEYQIKQEKSLREAKTYLTENLVTLKMIARKNPGQLPDQLMYLYDYLHHGQAISNKSAGDNWNRLIEPFGVEVAQFYRDSAVRFWRNHIPILYSEGFSFNKISNGTRFGLAGLKIEFQEITEWPIGLTDGEVELACKYASFELNGFPIWLEKLFTTYPEIVSRFLLKEILYELSLETPESAINYILNDLSWSGQWAWDRLAPEIQTLLKEKEPANLGNLGRMLKILQGSSFSSETIADLAAKKCAALTDYSHLSHWLAVWTGVDPDSAIFELQERLASIKNAPEATDFAMRYVTHLFPDRLSRIDGCARTAFHTAQHLKSLFLLMNQYIRPEEDIERANRGMYSPDLRDYAQDARSNLFSILSKIPGKETYLALRDIADFFPERPRFRRFALDRAGKEGDLGAMSPSEVRELNDFHERTPKNHRELAELAQMRLLDLKDELENGDNSPAETWIKIDSETEMRNNIGRELREKAFGRYTIAHEYELADGKMPDLRFEGVGFDAPVPVELKLAEKWTCKQLLERLENQLCRDYLRDMRSTHGILLLVNREFKRRWQLPHNTGSVDFEGLILAIRNFWNNNLSTRVSNLDDIAIVGIDLTHRKLRPPGNTV